MDRIYISLLSKVLSTMAFTGSHGTQGLTFGEANWGSLSPVRSPWQEEEERNRGQNSKSALMGQPALLPQEKKYRYKYNKKKERDVQ